MKKSIIYGFIAVLLLVAACSHEQMQQPTTTDSMAQMHTSSPVAANSPAQQELARVGDLIEKGTATADDLETLKTLVKDDEHAQDELSEIGTMLTFKEYQHAGHGLGFLSSYLETGKDELCPGHELAHYYVFSRHGEDDMAAEGLEGAKEELPKWLPKAKAYDAKYPGPHSADEVAGVITKHIADIESGKITATDEEIDYLANALCVDDES